MLRNLVPRATFSITLLLILVSKGNYLQAKETPDQPIIGVLNLKKEDYFASITKAGGIPVAIFAAPESEFSTIADSLDGLILPGGSDIPPQEYGESPHPTVKAMSAEKYQFNAAFTNYWLRNTKKPIFGICLGLQSLNVIAGGSLIQDIPSEIGTDHRKEHAVQITDLKSKLYRILGKQDLVVNSRHHQAIRNLGKELKATAQSPDGVIEAIEMPGERFVVAVQWHPEKMPNDTDQERLMSAFVSECSRVRGKVKLFKN